MQMRSLWFPILVLALGPNSNAGLTAPKPELRTFSHLETNRAVIGSVADASIEYDNGRPITVIHILQFSTDVFPQEPILLQVRLCGNHGHRLEPAVHTNITLVYNSVSHSRLTGCLRLISSKPWEDGSKWHTVTFTPRQMKRSRFLDNSIQGIIDGTVIE